MTKPPTGLTPEQRDELANELERQLTRLKRSMAITDEGLRTVELDQTSVGRLSRMDALQSQSMSRGLREREVVRLSQILDALARLAADSYGVCTRCGGGITFERLFVFPEAPECAACVTGP